MNGIYKKIFPDLTLVIIALLLTNVHSAIVWCKDSTTKFDATKDKVYNLMWVYSY